MVSFDSEKYLKNKPPPPPDGMDKLPVTARYAYTSYRVLLSPNTLQLGDNGDPRDQRDPADTSAEIQSSHDLG